MNLLYKIFIFLIQLNILLKEHGNYILAIKLLILKTSFSLPFPYKKSHIQNSVGILYFIK